MYLDEMKKRGYIRVGVADDVLGKSLWNPKTLRMEGFEPEVGRLLATELFGTPEKAEFTVLAGKGKLNSLKENRVDIVISSLTITEERAEQIDFSRPYFIDKETLLVLKGGPIKTLADLKGKKVAVTAASATLPIFEKHFPQAEILVVQDKPLGIQALLSNQVVALVNTNVNLSLLKASMSDGDRFDIVDTGNHFPPKRYGIGVKKGNPDLVEFLNTALDKLEKSGALKRLYAEYGVL
jgi:ABC-type amino acid transport substrate-binding protein